MKGASIEGGVKGRRLASEYSVASAPESLPVRASTRRILIPPQKLPQTSHGAAFSSKARFGSMAFQSSSGVEPTTLPSSTHRYSELIGSSVRFVVRPMTDRFLPNVE